MEPGSVHPLLLPHVLEMIFKSQILTEQDLLQMRAVCRDWRIYATKAYSARATLTLKRAPELKRIDAMHTTSTLMQDPHVNLPMPVKLFIHINFFCDHRGMLKTLQGPFEKLLELAAPHLEALMLKIKLNFRHDEEMDMIPFEMLVSFPKLKVFDLLIDLTISGSELYLLQMATRVLANSPCLKEVRFMENLSGTPKLDQFLRLVPATVQRLHITSSMLCVSKLSVLVLPNLKYLNIVIGGVIDSHGEAIDLVCDDVFHIFNECRQTLTELSVDLKMCAVDGVKFPIFPHLTTLTLLIDESTSEEDPQHHSVERFTKIFPKVKWLNLAEMINSEVLEALFPPGFHAPKVEACELSEISSPEVMLNFTLGFSNVKKLVISPLNARKTLPVLFGNMSKLEELVLYLKRKRGTKRFCVDSMLTGIPKHDCSNIRAVGNYDSINLLDLKTNPGITDLKRKFRGGGELKSMRVLPISRMKLFLTDVTGYLGLLKMDSLKQLEVDRFNLTPACINQIKQRFGEEAIVDTDVVYDCDMERFRSEDDTDSSDAESDLEFELPLDMELQQQREMNRLWVDLEDDSD